MFRIGRDFVGYPIYCTIQIRRKWNSGKRLLPSCFQSSGTEGFWAIYGNNGCRSECIPSYMGSDRHVGRCCIWITSMGLCIKLNMKYVMTGVIDINDISRTWFKQYLFKYHPRHYLHFVTDKYLGLSNKKKLIFIFSALKCLQIQHHWLGLRITTRTFNGVSYRKIRSSWYF